MSSMMYDQYHDQNDNIELDKELFVDDDDEINENELNVSGQKKQKDSNKKKRNRNKKKKTGVNRQNESRKTTVATNGETISFHNDGTDKENQAGEDDDDEKIEIEVVPEEVTLDKNYAEFAKVFDYFKFTDAAKDAIKKEETDAATAREADMQRLKGRLFEEEEEEEKEKEKNEDGQPKMSKKKLKKMTQLSVAALKQLVNRPDVVEMYDVTARDPKLLVHLKATRNTVPVPRHWCAKRKYLQGKRGFEKPAFELPDFIKRTGIQSMREAIQDKEQNKTLKQKMREKVRPKMGKIDIDYQKLHDAFFRWQTKPRMSIHGDLYYEGKELETKLKEKKPGNLTDDLRISLGMPVGPNSERVPPPWLIAMQRYGPPPSYPSLKIPGLNAPIPDGCSFGYHAGGWGKPPVDEFGRPLYGDVFGTSVSDMRKPEEEEPIDTTLWGGMEDEVYEEIPPEDESEEESDELASKAREGKKEGEDEESVDMEDTSAGLKTPGEGLMTPSGISTTVSAGLETPDMIELRKRKTQIESEMESSTAGTETPALYKILPEKATSVGSSMMGSSKVYDISAAKKASLHDSSGISSSATGIDMTLNPDELEMESDVLQSKLDQLKQTTTGGADTEDMGDATAGEHSSKQNKKRKKQTSQASTPAAPTPTSSADKDKNKKYKEFKF